jgi:hypothetical protein
VRPVQAGGFPVYWDADHRFVPTTGFTQSVTDMLSMPPDHAAVVSDSETTFDGYAFPVTHRVPHRHRGTGTGIDDKQPPNAPLAAPHTRSDHYRLNGRC